MSDGMTQVEFLAIGDGHTILSHLIKFLIYILDEVLSCCFQEQDLIVVVSVMAEVTALLAHQLVVDAAKSHIVLEMVGAD